MIILYLFFLCSFHDTFRNTDPGALESDELASDGIIMDLTYSPERYADYFCWTFSWKIFHCKLHLLHFCRNEFAYASSDKLVYIRQFSDRGAEMTLSAVLQGHEAEVTQVRLP